MSAELPLRDLSVPEGYDCPCVPPPPVGDRVLRRDAGDRVVVARVVVARVVVARVVVGRAVGGRFVVTRVVDAGRGAAGPDRS